MTTEYLEQSIDKSFEEWYNISHTLNIPIELLRQYKQFINWDAICQNKYYNFNDTDFVRQFADKMDWTSLMNRKDVYNQIKEQYKKEFNLVKVVGFTWWGTRKTMWYVFVQ